MDLKFEFFARHQNARAPLVLMVHGRAGNLQVMQAFRRLVPAGCSIVSVQAPLEDPKGGYSWWEFDPELDLMQGRNKGAKEAAKVLGHFLTNLAASTGLEPRSVIGVGFSQGAAVLSCLLQTSEIPIHGVALLAGFVVPLENVQTIPAIPVFVAHGTEDDIVPFELAEKGRDLLRDRGAIVTFVSERVGHKVGVEGMRALGAWFKEQLPAVDLDP